MIHTFYLDKDREFHKDISHDEIKKALSEKGSFIWIDFESATGEENQLLTDVFNFHPLAVEDCIKFSHHPKLDNYEDYLFLVLHAADTERKKEEELSTLELNMFVADNYVVTYHKKPVRSVIATKKKCLNAPEKVLGEGSDFLMHKLIDSLVDNYLPTLLQLEHEIDLIEDAVLEAPTDDILNRVLYLKKDVMYLKKIIGPQRNTIYKVAHGKFPFVGKESKLYFSDIFDELYRYSDQIESYRDLLNGLVDTYLSMTSVKTNQVMKTLTVVMTIIMPLTLITGIYGMNFKNMPETNSPYGYFVTLFVMFLMALVMVFYMKRKNWF